MDQPGIGIIGPGAIADLHADALAGLGVPIVAAAGPNQEDLEGLTSRHDVPAAYTDNDALLADPRVEAVIVAAPSPVHASLTSAALRAGKPVLCEVPLAVDADEGAEVAALAKQTDLTVAVAHTLRYWEPHQQLARAVADAGQPAKHVVVRSAMLRQSDTGWTGKTREWTDSAVWHHGSHAVDAALWFLGDVEVAAQANPGPRWHNGRIMDVAFALRTSDDRIAMIDLSYHSRAPKADYMVITEADTWEVDGGVLTRNGEVVEAWEVAGVQSEAVTRQDAAFLARVRGEQGPLYTAADALPALRILALAGD